MHQKGHIYQQLYQRGHTATSWAEQRGYTPRNVTQTIDRWVTDRDSRRGEPRGQTRQILKALERDLGLTLIGGTVDAIAS